MSWMHWAAVAAAALLFSPTHAASFDCDKAHTAQERLICSDDSLSEMDSDMASLYRVTREILKGEAKAGLLAEQRTWNRETAAQCPVPQTGDIKPSAQCLAERYDRRRLAIVELLQKAALEQAVETKAGPYLFKQVTIHFDENNDYSYPVLMGQSAEIEKAFNLIITLKQKDFLDRCEEDYLKSRVEVATDKMVTIQSEGWHYCHGRPHGYPLEHTLTILMQPKPHLVEAAELFRPNTSWKADLPKLCVKEIENDTVLTADEIAAPALDSRNWAVWPNGLHIQLGMLKGYAGGDFECSISWRDLDGLLVDDPPFRAQ